jgi:hypothetical protein
MNRRNFLRSFLGAAVVASTNPVHFIAPIGGWSSPTIINPQDPSTKAGFAFLNAELEVLDCHMFDSMRYATMAIWGKSVVEEAYDSLVREDAKTKLLTHSALRDAAIRLGHEDRVNLYNLYQRAGVIR